MACNSQWVVTQSKCRICCNEKIILSRWKNFAKKFQLHSSSRLRQSNILSFKIYLKFLSLAYFIGFIFHLADILDLRFIYSKMDRTWQIWTVYLTIMDLAAAFGLWRQKRWGSRLFLIVASSQLVIYLVFINKFGRQDFLVGFHLVTIIIYIFHSWRTAILIKHIYKKLLDKKRTEANKVEIWTDVSLPLDSKFQ